MLPMMVGIMVASLLSGQLISRTGRYKMFPIIGTALLVIALLLLHTISVDTPFWEPTCTWSCFGAGLGLHADADARRAERRAARDMGVATASATFFRQLGGTLGTAVFLSILFSAAPSKIAERFREAGVRPPTGAVDLNDTSDLKTLPPAVKEPILAGFSDAMNVVFLVGALRASYRFRLSIMMKEVLLRQMSGIEQARADAAAAAAAAAPADGAGRQRCRKGRRPCRPMAGARPGYRARTAPIRLRGHPPIARSTKACGQGLDPSRPSRLGAYRNR